MKRYQTPTKGENLKHNVDELYRAFYNLADAVGIDIGILGGRQYPVGCFFDTTDTRNPSVYLGGEWSLWGNANGKLTWHRDK